MDTAASLLLPVEHCAGCNDDFYNGHNDIGVKACWMRAIAKLIPTVLIHVDQAPPYRNLDWKDRPTCYKAKRYATVKPQDLDAKGYWKS